MRTLGSLLSLALLLTGCAAPPLPTAPGAPGPALRLACLAPCDARVEDHPQAAVEPSLAVDPQDPAHLVIVASQGDFTGSCATGDCLGKASKWNYVYISRDGGATWGSTRVAGGPGTDLPTTVDMADAVVAMLPGGVVLHAGMAATFHPFGSTGPSLYVDRSADGGATFPERQVLMEGSGTFLPMAGVYNATDKPGIAAGPDGASAILAWTHIAFTYAATVGGGGNTLVFSLTRDTGRTWSAPAPLTDLGAWSGAAPAILSDGTLLVAYMEFGEGYAHKVARSTDGGATWTHADLGPGSGAQFPSVAVHRAPGGDIVYLAKVEPGDATYRTVLYGSRDQGLTWEGPAMLDANPDTVQPVPTVAVDAEGVAYVLFYDGDRTEELTASVAAVRDMRLSGMVVVGPEVPAVNPRFLGDYFGAAGLPSGAGVAYVGVDEGFSGFRFARVGWTGAGP